jgi:hypothetical protein
MRSAKVTEAAATTSPIAGPHRLRARLTIASALLGLSLTVYAGTAWPSSARPEIIEGGLVGALLSVLVLKWPRLAGIGLLLVTTAEFLMVVGANVSWRLQLTWPFFFVAGGLAEGARRPDGHRGFVLRVVTETAAVPLVAFLAVVIWFVVSLSSMCQDSGC